MTSSTTTRKGAADHKAGTNQRAGTVQKAAEQHETTPSERAQAQRGKAEVEQARSGVAFPRGFKLPGGTKGNLLWWGSLAALAALEIVDWPVAALVAAGSWVAEQHAKQQKQLKRAEAAAS